MSKQYDRYLVEHIHAVQKAMNWMLNNIESLEEETGYNKSEFVYVASVHDMSKRGPHEYSAYDDYFYGERDEDAFNRAWLHHIHNNPHHWQHWVLINDDGSLLALEMPKLYALEMIADWWSFSWRSGNLSEVFDWYEKHKGVMVLHPNTREFVEGVLGEIKEKLEGK
jgi:hypothetical protein